jgi:hypothetical protein
MQRLKSKRLLIFTLGFIQVGGTLGALEEPNIILMTEDSRGAGVAHLPNLHLSQSALCTPPFSLCVKHTVQISPTSRFYGQSQPFTCACKLQ